MITSFYVRHKRAIAAAALIASLAMLVVELWWLADFIAEVKTLLWP